MSDDLDDIELRCSDVYCPHMPVLLLLDYSLLGLRNFGAPLVDYLANFKRDVMGDPVGRKRVEVCILGWDVKGGSEQGFVKADELHLPRLSDSGGIKMTEGIPMALDALAERCRFYCIQGIPHFRPKLVLILRGSSAVDWQHPTERIRDNLYQVDTYVLDVGSGTDRNLVTKMAALRRPPIDLNTPLYEVLFMWLVGDRHPEIVRYSMEGDRAEPPLPSPEKWTQGWEQV